MTIITIANQKGGVGKTTTAVTLAHGLAELNGRDVVLLLDLDPQAQCSTALGLDAEPGVYNLLVGNHPIDSVIRATGRQRLWIIPGNADTAHAQTMLTIQRKPDEFIKNLLPRNARWVVIDTSPSIGGLQERALYAADLIIIPTSTNYLSANAVAQTIATIEENRGRGAKGTLLGILPTFHEDWPTENREILNDLLNNYPGQVLDPIHRATVLCEAAAAGKTIWEYDGKSRAGQEYAKLLHRILKL